MISTPWTFESNLAQEDFQKIGELTLRWSLIDHYLGHCLQILLRLSDEEAAAFDVFRPSAQRKLELITKLAKTPNNLSKVSQAYLDELKPLINALTYVRNNVIHAVPGSGSPNFTFHLRSKQNDLTKEEVFSTEEITNYTSHLVIALVASLQGAATVVPVSDKPEMPAFLRDRK
jgi:hypothetical protein